MGEAKFRGNVPRGGVELVCFDGWILFHRPAADAPPWRSLKLISKAPRSAKANFWIGWNGTRIASTDDGRLLSEVYPELNEKVVAWLSENMGQVAA